MNDNGKCFWGPYPAMEFLAQDKIDIMKQAVAKCPKISILSKVVQVPSLLDLGSKVSLIHSSHFKEHLLPKIEAPTGWKIRCPHLYSIWQQPMMGSYPWKKNVELDINFLGLKVPNAGFLILEEPNRVLDRKHQTKLPGIIGWNLI